VAVTTALAVGEAVEATGRAALEAMIAGVEVMCRIGLAVPGRFHARHYHPTALAGSFAAAAAAGRLYGLAEDQLVHALGICGSQASGIIEYLTDGSWTKRLHPGWAAHAGVTAALLARAGFTGPETVFEGAHGFYAAFAGHDAARGAPRASAASGLALTFKPYPCGTVAQPYMDVALRLRGGTGPRRRRSPVRCRPAGRCRCLWEPLVVAPPNGYAAKFSAPAGVILVKGGRGWPSSPTRRARAEVLPWPAA
jgi:2-methylcitrate dehydratase PrpD